MNDVLSRLDELYTEYLHDMNRLSGEHHNLRGAFSRLFGGSSVGPGSDSCNDRFYNGVKRCIDRCAESGASSDDAAQIIRYVLAQERPRPCGRTELLMLQAAHGCLIPLVSLLEPEAAAALSGEYSVMISDQAPLPVQKQLFNELKKQAGSV